MALSPSLTRGAPPHVSPSIFGGAEQTNNGPSDGFLLPEAATSTAPAAAARNGNGRASGRIPTPPPVPEGPPKVTVAAGAPPPLLAEEASTAADESYGADERALNEFISLHPMLSMGKPNHSNTHTNPA